MAIDVKKDEVSIDKSGNVVINNPELKQRVEKLLHEIRTVGSAKGQQVLDVNVINCHSC